MPQLKLDDNYLIKLKLANISNKIVAGKLGVTVEEVEKAWERIQIESVLRLHNGHVELNEQFTVLANQFQLMGESLKIVATALANETSLEELIDLIDGDPEKSAHRIRQKCIVLRAFRFVDPVESAQKTLQGN